METRKVVINRCFGGFGLSKKALNLLKQKKGTQGELYPWDICRWDPDLVSVVEELGEEANDSCAELVIVEVPMGKKFIIDEYDGSERISFADDVEWIIL